MLAPLSEHVMKRSLQVTRGFAALLFGAVLSTTAFAQKQNNSSVPASNTNVSAKDAKLPVAAVDIEAHLRSHVVTSVTVGAPIEPAQAPALAVKNVVAVR